MTARKAVFGLCALCAMLFSAFAAQSAMAVSQTGVTCASTGTPINSDRFLKEHCKESDKNAAGTFYHVAWGKTKTKGDLTNTTTKVGEVDEKEPGFLKATIGGLSTIIEAKTVEAEGFIENLTTTPETGEMYITGTTSAIKFKEVSVTNRPCEFVGINPGGSKTAGSVETQAIMASTKGQAKGVALFEPEAGPKAKFAEFELKGASCPEALKGTYPVFGTVLSGAAEGATLPLLHETVTGEPAPKLRLKNAEEGPVAGLAGKVTIKAGEEGTATSTWKPITVT
jgi:hypothetical protein